MFDTLFRPEVVAVVGASRRPHKVGHEIVANLVGAGFNGAIVPVNPAASDILGLKCYRDLAAYGKPVDLSVIALPSALVCGAVRDSLKAGAKAICIISAGFRETGDKGARLESDIAQLCSAERALLLGPNCLGLIDTHHCMNASFAKQVPRKGAISVMSQSGALCTAILDCAAGRHLGLAKLVSMGNKADLDETDFLSAFASDDETKVIVGYLESIECGKLFVKAAEEAASVKPVVLLKAGVTDAGIKAASSHTGSLGR